MIEQKHTITRKIMADNKVSATINSYDNIDETVDKTIQIDNENYYLNRPSKIVKGNKQVYKTTLDYEADIYFLLNKKVLNLGNLTWTLFGDLEFFLNLLVTNINETYSGWTYENKVTTENQTISVSATDCRSFLNTLADQFEVEFDIQNRHILVDKYITYDTALTVEYGKGKGLYELTRTNIDDQSLVTRVYGEGGSTNSKDGNNLTFDGGYVEDLTTYTDVIEGVYTNPDIYPRFVGSITSVNNDTNEVGIDSLDFNLLDYLNEGQAATLNFRDGNLAGKSFEIQDGSYDDDNKTFRIIATTDETGTTYPNDTFKINVGDSVFFTNIFMPDSYITNAKNELKSFTQQYLSDNSKPRVSYSLTFDHRLLRNYDINIRPYSVIRVIDNELGIDKLIRISSTTQVKNGDKTESFKATVSDYVTLSLQSRLISETIDNKKEIENNSTQNIEIVRQNTLRYNNLNNQIFDTDGYFDPSNIKPKSIETLMLSVGAKSGQFQLNGVTFSPNTNSEQGNFSASQGTLEHFSIFRPDGSGNWSITAQDYTDLDETKFYYLYCECDKITNGAIWRLTTEQLGYEDETSYYFLIGILQLPVDGVRPVDFTYGYTMINGGQITTGIIRSYDGKTFINLQDSKFNIGDSTAGLDWGVTTPNVLTIRGGIVQSGGGATAPLSVFRGQYQDDETYYKGDSVSFEGSKWFCTATVPITGVTPSEGDNWTIEVASGTGASVAGGGDYEETKTYYGTPQRVDVVKFNDLYYVAKPDAGEFSGIDPTDTSKWSTFGATFDSVATEVFFAEKAKINNLIVDDLATDESGKRVVISKDTNSIEFFVNGQDNATVKLDANSSGGGYGDLSVGGGIECRYDNDATYCDTDGIFSNSGKKQFLGGSTGMTAQASVVGLGFENVPKGVSNYIFDGCVAGGYFSASNQGTGNSIGVAGVAGTGSNNLGGYFTKAHIEGLSCKNLYVKASSETTINLSATTTNVFCYESFSTRRNIYLPTHEETPEGTVIFVKSITESPVSVFPNSNQILQDDTSTNTQIDLFNRREYKFTYTRITNGGKYVWVFSQISII